MLSNQKSKRLLDRKSSNPEDMPSLERICMEAGSPLTLNELLLKAAEPCTKSCKAAKIPAETLESKKKRKDRNLGSSGLAFISKLCLGSFVVLLVATAITYITASDSFTVETNLLFVSSDEKNHETLSLEKELSILQSPKVAISVANQLYLHGIQGEQSKFSAKPTKWDLEAAAFVASPESMIEEHNSKFERAPSLIKWLSDGLVVESSVKGNKAHVKLSLDGADPEFLKTVLDTYIRRYAEQRRGINGEEYSLLSRGPRTDGGKTSNLPDSLTQQIQTLEWQLRECELALKLLESRKGVFGGFVSTRFEGIPSLTHFQNKIVELEINRRALSVRYAPNSREIRNIDLEIQGIKDAMRECLTEHFHFLKTGKEMLVARKKELESRVDTSDECSKRPCSGQFPNGDRWHHLPGGIHIIQDKPHVSRKPALVKLGEYTEALLTYLPAPIGFGDSQRQQESPDHKSHSEFNLKSKNQVDNAIAG